MKEKKNICRFATKPFWVFLLGSLLNTATLRAQTNIWDYLSAWHSSTDIASSREGKKSLTLKVNETPLQVSYTGSHVDFIVPAEADQNILAFTVRGADGGSRVNTALLKAFHTKGGGGAVVEGYLPIGSGAYEVPTGSTLRFIVGKCGDQVNSALADGADGGAGTGLFLRKPGESTWHILMVAGGGGGAYSDCCTSHSEGKSASATTSGIDGGGLADGGKAGTNGEGGDQDSGVSSSGRGINGVNGAIKNGIPLGSSDCWTDGPGYDPTTHCSLFGCAAGGRGYASGGGGGGYSGGGSGGASAGGGGGGSYLNAQWIKAGKIDITDKTQTPQNGHISFYFTQTASIKLAKDTSKCINDYGAHTDNGTNIQLLHCQDNPAQQWMTSGPGIRLGKNLDKCIDLDSWLTYNGTNIRLWDCAAGQNNQVWIYDVANQSIRSGVDFNKCMDLDHGNTADETNIRLWDCNNSGAQKWLIEGIPSSMPSSAEKNSLRLALNPGKCIDLSEGNTTNGANIQLWDCQNGNKNQIFFLDDRAIRMQSSPEKCIDLSAGNTANGANIQLWDCQNGNKNQQWIYDGFAKAFRSAVNINKCMDLSAGNTANGANIQLWDCQGGNLNQQFLIGQ